MKLHFPFLCFVCLAFLSSGCKPPEKPAPAPIPAPAPASTASAHAGHSHDVGPNGGLLAVLGNHELHVEVIGNEESGKVTAQIFDGSMKPLAVSTKEITINIPIDGKNQAFVLPLEKEFAEGSAATFSLTEKVLAEKVCDGWQGRAEVMLTNKETPLSGKLAPPEAGHQH